MRKTYISDAEVGEFILSCFKLNVACKKLAKEVDDMLQIKCIECRSPLTDEEIQEAKQNNLKMDDVVCDKCWQAWMKEKSDEERHPDKKGA